MTPGAARPVGWRSRYLDGTRVAAGTGGVPLFLYLQSGAATIAFKD
ncbi:hypothetical protein [Myxococcus qinghaiensis]|nr:hypothetical protein [Myxococcus qinghaiensis]MCP3167900.1 hypothetical protein [Myxococcus qinghaiensis]